MILSVMWEGCGRTSAVWQESGRTSAVWEESGRTSAVWQDSGRTSVLTWRGQAEGCTVLWRGAGGRA